jgi:hypothetical protein
MNALRTVFTNMVNTGNRRLRGCLIHANFKGTGGGHDTGDIAADFDPVRIAFLLISVNSRAARQPRPPCKHWPIMTN